MLEDQFLNYGPEDFIEEDLKRLKKWVSLRDDIRGQYKIICGSFKEIPYPPPNNFCGGLITCIKHPTATFLCFKERVPVIDPPMTPSEGARLIFAIVPEIKMFVPLLVYGAFEEGMMYEINNKKYPLTKSRLGKIINEKLKRLL